MFTYYSVVCSNYHALFATLLQMHIPFEYHDKHRTGYSYADFSFGVYPQNIGILPYF